MASQTIGFIGLGAMGMGMAKRLLAHGFAVRGYDVRPEARAAFAAAGGQAVEQVRDAGTGSGILFVMVFNAEQIEEVLFTSGILDEIGAGSTIIVSSTVAAPFIRELATRIDSLGHRLIDGPVSGGVPAAQDGTLTMMGAGSKAAFDHARQALGAITGTLYQLSEEPGVGSYVKAVNQLLAGVHVAVAAEGMALGTRAGADPRVLYNVIRQSAGSSVLFERKVPQMLDADYVPPKSAVEIWVKDLGAVLDAGRELRFPLPMTAAAHQLYLSAAAAGHGQDDYASVVTFFEDIAGISLSDRNKGSRKYGS